MKKNQTRREFGRKLLGASVACLTPWSISAYSTTMTRPRNLEECFHIFSAGIASGDPTPSGVILWTKIDKEFYRPEENLLFLVSSDEDFSKPLLSGQVYSEDITAENDFTVKIDLDGKLDSNSVYFYRFEYREKISEIGRCRTLPAENEHLTKLRLAVFTCQNISGGYYTAFQDLVRADNADFCVHLGDFIYEYVGYKFSDPSRNPELPSGESTANSLADYRYLYTFYRKDRNLRKALARFTWMMVPDDHETANNCYWDYENNTMVAPNHPFNEKLPPSDVNAYFFSLKIASQKAWSEYTPSRPSQVAEATHPHEFLKKFRSFKLGLLGTLYATDTRTYRQKPELENGSMLGIDQRDWLLNGLTQESGWPVWANQTLFSELSASIPTRGKTYFNTDAWDGYKGERTYILETLKSANVKNLVVLTGDMHTCLRSSISIQRSEIGTEYMVPAVSSSPAINVIKRFIEKKTQVSGFRPESAVVRLFNPHIRYFNARVNGYGLMTLSPEQALFEAYSVDITKDGESSTAKLIHRHIQKKKGA